jgi:hypothetical protein
VADLMTKNAANITKVKVKNSRNDSVVDAILESVARDGKSITVVMANQKIRMTRLEGKPGMWIANAYGMELTAQYRV